MKTKSNIISLFVLLLMLSSCGSLSVSRMRYTRGLNINLSAKETAQEEHKAKVAEKHHSTKTILTSENNKSDETRLLQTSVEETKDLMQSQSAQGITNSSSSTSSSKFKDHKNGNRMNIIHKSKDDKQIKLKKTIFNAPGKQESNDSDVALLLLIIIALFIPPLAVFLYYGEFNGQFWISLILTLLAAGLLGVGFIFGWGVPIIHALLVLFGVFG